MNKLFYKISSGVFGGTILGMASFFFLLGQNERHGECFAFANFLFNLVGYGYEPCGNTIVLIGVPVNIISTIVVGSFLGIFLIGRIKMIHYLRYSFALIFSSFFLLFLFLSFRNFPEFLRINDLFFIFYFVSIFILFSAIPSTIFALMANWLEKIRQ